MAIKSYEERLKEQERLNKAELDKSISASNKNFDGQKQLITDTYNREIDNTADSYESKYDENAVQKIINEREIAENMANLGLTDSGLNRTQQTAVQLSYANNKNKIDISKQKAVSSLTAQLADKITQIDLDKANAAESIRQNWDAVNKANAQEIYNNEVKSAYDYQTKIDKALIEREQEASYMISVNGGTLRADHLGSLASNGVRVEYTYDNNGNKIKTTYTDTISGKKTTMDSRINPYTNTVNPDVENGVWENGTGYQPDNIGGTKLKAVPGETGVLNGIEQKIFELKKGRNGHNVSYYIWDGRSNRYIETIISNGEWVIK